MITCKRYRVSGRVQGVFFRASTREEARRLGLTGWVRNTSDGAVEVLACGDAEQLHELDAWLWQGPPSSRVHTVVSEPVEDEIPPVKFTVR